MSKSIVTPIGRASFPHLSKPNMFGKYAITILLPKANPKVKEFVKWLAEAVKAEAVNVAGQDGLKAAMQEFSAFRDGDKPEQFKTYRSEFAGHWVLGCSRNGDLGKPCVVNRQKQPIDPSEIYAGCKVVAYIDVYGYKYASKKSVSIGVQHIMKAGDDTPFTSTGIPVENAFDDIDLPEDEESGEVFEGQSETPAPTKKPTPKPSSDPFAGI